MLAIYFSIFYSKGKFMFGDVTYIKVENNKKWSHLMVVKMHFTPFYLWWEGWGCDEKKSNVAKGPKKNFFKMIITSSLVCVKYLCMTYFVYLNPVKYIVQPE
jgi:hypothetical protein